MNIVFCLPGREFSNKFLNSWTSLIHNIPKDWKWAHVTGYVPNITYSRQSLLDRAKMFRPTHYMWIDSDQVFNPNQFLQLASHDLPIISGLYKKENLPDQFAGCKLNGETLTTSDIEGVDKPIEVLANGMGFMLVKSEVFDLIEKPFEFLNEHQWEDFGFADKARKLGFKSYIDPAIIVGHEKKIVI